MTTSAPVYRPDIDGLRAVAVLAVIAFHLDPGGLPGGFLGVDVFFVISGFLITAILARDIGAAKFSLWRFYERRLRRIGPALLVVLMATSAAATAVLLPVDLLGFARSLLATLGFVSNVYFWRDTDYFSRAAGEKPLLHTWSLGIEEQFYVLFPLILWLGFRLRRQAVPTMIALLTLASLAAAVFALRIGAGLPAFYLLPTRAWELGAGALLVFAPRGLATPWATAISLVGAAAVTAALVLDPALLPPLLPPPLLAVAGAVALIAAGRDAIPVGNRLLAARGPVLIGQMSYSLYLWHWPILVVARYFLVRDLRPVETSAIFVAIVAIGGLSWRFIETPFRNRAYVPVRVLLVTCGAMAVLLVAIAGVILASGGFPGRLNAQAARINAAVGTNYRCPIGDYLAFGASRGCVVALPTRDPGDADVVVFGNSHAQMYTPLIADILTAHGLHGLLVPANGCLPWTATNIDVPCQTIAATNLKAIVGLRHARVVVVAFSWRELDGNLIDGAGRPVARGPLIDRIRPLDATITALRAAGKRVVVIGPIAEPGWDVASVVSRDLAFHHPIDRPLFVPAAEFATRFGPAIEVLAARRDMIFVRPDRIQCRTGQCVFIMNGRSLFADDNHLAQGSLAPFAAALEAAITMAANPF